MTPDQPLAPSAAKTTGLPPPIEELAYEPVGPVRKWLTRILVTAVIVGGVGAIVLYAVPRVPGDAVRVARAFAEAVNADEFPRQYALLAPAEPLGPQGADIPLLDEGELRTKLNSAVEPSFFSGFKLRMDFSQRKFSVRGKHRIWQFQVPISDYGTAPKGLPGQNSGYLTIPVDVTRRPFRVLGFAAYSSFYFNNYSMDTNRKFNRLLLQAYGTEAPSLPSPGAPPQ